MQDRAACERLIQSRATHLDQLTARPAIMYIHQRISIMDLQIAKWGNSLALRIPSDVVRQLGLREGASVQAQVSVDGTLSIRPARWNREAFAQELSEARSAMVPSEPVVTELRRTARY
jgi:antitoxin MazE